MSPDNKNEPIKITLDDLARVETVGSSVTTATPGKIAGGAKVYGSVGEAAEQRVEAPEERGSILLQGWFYLGTAGLIGATLAWAIAETGFIDQGGRRWGNLWMMPMVVTLQCVGFAIAESLVERSPKKAVVRGLLADGVRSRGGSGLRHRWAIFKEDTLRSTGRNHRSGDRRNDF